MCQGCARSRGAGGRNGDWRWVTLISGAKSVQSQNSEGCGGRNSYRGYGSEKPLYKAVPFAFHVITHHSSGRPRLAHVPVHPCLTTRERSPPPSHPSPHTASHLTPSPLRFSPQARREAATRAHPPALYSRHIGRPTPDDRGLLLTRLLGVPLGVLCGVLDGSGSLSVSIWSRPRTSAASEATRWAWLDARLPT